MKEQYLLFLWNLKFLILFYPSLLTKIVFSPPNVYHACPPSRMLVVDLILFLDCTHKLSRLTFPLSFQTQRRKQLPLRWHSCRPACLELKINIIHICIALCVQISLANISKRFYVFYVNERLLWTLLNNFSESIYTCVIENLNWPRERGQVSSCWWMRPSWSSHLPWP